jgi:hypothetical protein
MKTFYVIQEKEGRAIVYKIMHVIEEFEVTKCHAENNLLYKWEIKHTIHTHINLL